MGKLISIIIPTFNRAHLIGETLDSVLQQTYRNWEYIVVDDGSKDYTKELVEFYVKNDNRIKFYHRPHNRLAGGNAARNYGFEVSQGDFIQWFDSDNIMLPKNLELKLNYIQESGADLVVCENAEIFHDSSKKTQRKWSIKEEGDVLFNHLSGIVAFDTNGPMFRRDFLENKDLFDEKLKIGQDWEFFSRLLIEKPDVSYLFQTLYNLRTLEDGIRKTKTLPKTLSKIKSEYNLFKLIKAKRYFKDHPYQDDYNRLVFYRILSRYEYLRKYSSNLIATEYLIKALPIVSKRFYRNGILRSLRNPGNFLSLAKILGKKKSNNVY